LTKAGNGIFEMKNRAFTPFLTLSLHGLSTINYLDFFVIARQIERKRTMKIASHIDRFGEIRKMLVDYFAEARLKKDSLLSDDFFKALTKKF